MKTKTITIPSCTLLVAELPEGAINPVISMGYLIFREPNYSNWMTEEDMMNPIKMIEWEEKHDPKDDYKDAIPVRVPDGEWKLINRLPEVTEDQAFEIVDHYEVSHNLVLTVTYAFKDYVNGIECDYLDEYLFDNPTESLDSLLESNGSHFESPVGDEPDYGTADTSQIQNWFKAQEQVWDRNRMYIFKQVK